MLRQDSRIELAKLEHTALFLCKSATIASQLPQEANTALRPQASRRLERHTPAAPQRRPVHLSSLSAHHASAGTACARSAANSSSRALVDQMGLLAPRRGRVAQCLPSTPTVRNRHGLELAQGARITEGQAAHHVALPLIAVIHCKRDAAPIEGGCASTAAPLTGGAGVNRGSSRADALSSALRSSGRVRSAAASRFARMRSAARTMRIDAGSGQSSHLRSNSRAI